MKIKIVPYNDEWPLRFEKIKYEIERSIVDNDVTIEHIGSTSVKNLAAKPIIDILDTDLSTAEIDKEDLKDIIIKQLSPVQLAKQIKELLPKICKAAEYENSIFSLAKALEKTQKLLNALENVIIPQYQQKIRFILATLEEREREEFARLKKVKASMEKRQ